MPNLDKYKKWMEIMKTLDTFSTKEEFLEAFRVAMKHILTLEKKLIEKNNKELEALKELFNKFQTSKVADFDKIKLEAKQFTDKLFKEQADNLNFLNDKVRNIKNGKDGKNGIDGKDGSPDTPKQLRDKLETLTGEEELKLNSINELRKELEEKIEKLGMTQIRGAAVRSPAPRIEDLTGTKNGTNKAFTVAHKPEFITFDGQTLYADGGFTLAWSSGVCTVTFDNAPQSDSVIKNHF